MSEHPADIDRPDWRRTAYELQRRIDELEEALLQARECCARPAGVCFNPLVIESQAAHFDGEVRGVR